MLIGLHIAITSSQIKESKEMFVFASSAAGLFVILVLGLFSKNLLVGWSELFTFGHPEELLTAKIKNAE